MSLFPWQRTAARARARLRVEPLEDRTQPSDGGGLLADAAGGKSLSAVDPVLLWNSVTLAAHVIDHTHPLWERPSIDQPLEKTP